MPRLEPQERWRRRTLERITALKLSGQLKPLRKKGLAVLSRDKQYTSEEWRLSFTQRAESTDYKEWLKECETVGCKYGIASFVVAMMCLIKRFDPEKYSQGMVIEQDWPHVRIVTESKNLSFVQRLTYEAQQLGLYVVHGQNGFETTQISFDAPSIEKESVSPTDTFRLRIETPIGYPPEAAVQLQKTAGRSAHELAKRMGYVVPRRLRVSNLVRMSNKLRVGKKPLEKGAAYDIVDKVYPNSSLSEDQMLRQQIASRRHKLRKRLFG